ncbi:MAG: hypothetical protein ACJ786_30620, partial [Catenulispora sp.]
MLEDEAALGRREAKLRAAAVTCLTGVALVQAVGLAPLLSESRPSGVLSLVAMMLCIALGWTLAAAPAGASRQLWRLIAATAGLVVAGWAVSHAFGIAGLPGSRGRWTAMPGAASAAFAGVALVLALVAAPPTRASARSLITATAVLAAMAPGTRSGTARSLAGTTLMSGSGGGPPMTIFMIGTLYAGSAGSHMRPV